MTVGDCIGFVDCLIVDEILDILETINFYTWEFLHVEQSMEKSISDFTNYN